MSQGTINQPQQMRSPIEGILQALQAVHAYYGIDTQKQQQKLLEAQTRGTTAEAESKELQTSALKDWMNGTDSTQPAPGATVAPNASAAVQGAQPTQRALPRNPFLLEFMKKQQDLTNAQAEGQIKAGEVANIPAKQKALQLELTSKGQGIANAAAEEKRKEQSQIGDYQKDFTEHYPGVADTLKNINDLSQTSKMLLSGSKQGVQLGTAKAELLGTGIQRFGPQLQKLGEDPSVLGRISNALSKGSTGFSKPEEISALNKVVNLMGQEANQSLDQAATYHASQVGARLGQDPALVKTKYVTPGLPKFSPVDSAVKIHPQTGQPILWRRDPKGWTPVTSGGE